MTMGGCGMHAERPEQAGGSGTERRLLLVVGSDGLGREA